MNKKISEFPKVAFYCRVSNEEKDKINNYSEDYNQKLQNTRDKIEETVRIIQREEFLQRQKAEKEFRNLKTKEEPQELDKERGE